MERGLDQGKRTYTIAAALYSICVNEGEHKTQEEVAKVARTNVVSVRNRARELRRHFDLMDPCNQRWVRNNGSPKEKT